MANENTPQGVNGQPNWRPYSQQTTPMPQQGQGAGQYQRQAGQHQAQQGAYAAQGAPAPPYQGQANTQTMPPNPNASQGNGGAGGRWGRRGGAGNGGHAHKGAKTFWMGFFGAALACVLAFSCFGVYNASSGKNVSGATVIGATTDTTINASDEDEDRAEAVADKVLPSVVSIAVYNNQSRSLSSIFGGGSSSQGSSSLTETSLGSGVIISQDGYILTNNHVVEGADALKVTANGEEYDATVVGTDSTTDLAVIKIDADDLTPIEIGDSDSLKQGQWVMTAGSPFGLQESVATGIISATSRTVTIDNSSSSGNGSGSSSSSGSGVSVYSNMIQTDAAINPGNSGGALVDQNGKLIGINAVIESYSGNYSGVGFAIPVNYAVNIAQQIIQGKTPTHASLGVAATTVTNQIAQRYSLDAQQGAYVSSVTSGGGADKAGLKDGDIITKVNDTQVTSVTDLIGAVRSHNVGDTVTVTYVRDGQTQTAQVQLGSDEGTSSSQSNSGSSRNGSSGNSGSNNGSSRGYGYGF